MSKPICEIQKLGLIDYQEAWDLQNRYAAEIATGVRPATLLLLEHPHTYTFGRRGDAGNLLWDEAELRQRGIRVHWVDRGGDVTYHGPGQLVGYPLLPLRNPPLITPLTGSRQAALPLGEMNRIPSGDYVGYIRKLEQVIITTVAEYGVTAKQVEGLTGVWIDEDQRLMMYASDHPSPIHKLAAIGVKVDARGISRHGFALNINPDMSYWEGIIGCGLPYPEISLAGLLDPVPEMEEVSLALLKAFGEIFDYQLDGFGLDD
ncbi:lipoyl(octanoyl) transferase LipB [Chloroflexota bacterium]